MQKLLVELQHNGEKALKLEGGLDTETPHITTRIDLTANSYICFFKYSKNFQNMKYVLNNGDKNIF